MNNTKCWICGGSGLTGEHKTKRSDLRDVFGTVTQSDPIYFHDNNRKNRLIGSLNAKPLKSPSHICANCNNARTQPHDRAWERLSAALRMRNPPIRSGTVVRADRIFAYNTAREMLNVHLYFVKLFGCHIVEGNIPIDTAKFGTAIIAEKAHPNVYLKFGVSPMPITGMSDIWTTPADCTFATWFYKVGEIAVNVMFAADGEKRNGLINAWHPKLGTNKLMIADFK
jgi:5-methylcytosine-specific restriction endonuclease McrA